MHLAFVLLLQARLPDPEDVARAFGELASERERLHPSPGADSVLEFQLSPRGRALVGLVPAAVPKGEADHGTRFSASGLGTAWTLPPHHAHLVVTLGGEEQDSAVESLVTFTALLAAIAQSSNAVGVYWGQAGATHSAEFFLSIARERDWKPKLMLWTGVSIAREPDGRLGLLSLGMKQMSLPDLLMIVPETWERPDALLTFFDLLAYVAERREPLSDGDTVGRTTEERRPVRYVPSPVDPNKRVWRVEFD